LVVIGRYLAGVVPLLVVRRAVPQIDCLPVGIVPRVEGALVNFELTGTVPNSGHFGPKTGKFFYLNVQRWCTNTGHFWREFSDFRSKYGFIPLTVPFRPYVQSCVTTGRELSLRYN
jgi:hypothetical protein